MNKLPERIILFDGVCNYCNAVVNFVLKRNKKQLIYFAPLQSEIANQIRQQYSIKPDIDSFVFIENNQAHVYSTGALRVCKYLSAGWPLCMVFLIIPAFMRNTLYKFIANNRYKWFGKTESCMVPQPQWKTRFLQ
jgi:predicted DCC family thiol-disulfide oxidoreductase YuxK